MRTIIFLLFIYNIMYLTKSYPYDDVERDNYFLPNSQAQSRTGKNFKIFTFIIIYKLINIIILKQAYS